MAKMVKKHSPKQGWVSKASNLAVWLIAFARPLQLLFEGRAMDIITEATGRLNQGVGIQGIDTALLLQFYSPVGAAVGVGSVLHYVKKHYPVR